MRRRLIATCCGLLLVMCAALGVWAPTVVAQDGGNNPTSSTVIDNRELGRIIQRPNAGKPPEQPGDPGGWLQVSLFFLICGVIVLIVLFVWWRSKLLRQRRAEAGLDPVDVAKRAGRGVRQAPNHPPTPAD
ncbi:MAG: hypothetical protein ACKOYM_06360 [Actinomycetes bacterium]